MGLPTTAAPEEWPEEARKTYEPVRKLGKGGFAVVWMVKKIGGSSSDEKPGVDGDDAYAAMKVIGDGRRTEATKSAASYAKREVSILSGLSHPNIVRLIKSFEPSGDAGVNSRHCIALSLAQGPTLDFIIRKGGALGLPMARSVSQQLVSGVAYMHGHAVIHRDIQPSNIIVSGAITSDAACWSDGEDGESAANSNRWHVTIVDFGFARALGPSQVDADVYLQKSVEGKEKLEEYDEADDVFIDCALQNGNANDSHFDKSVSRINVLDLSALGTRNYAAPEILTGVRKFAADLNDSLHGSKRKAAKSQPLSECVSNYSMVADSFSVGATIRHALTGVPPGNDVDEYIASKNRPSKLFVKRIRKMLKKDGDDDNKLEKRYRRSSDLPTEAKSLTQILTHYDIYQRATVRFANTHPWLKSSAPEGSAEKPTASEHGGPIVFLECALEEEKIRGEEKQKEIARKKEAYVARMNTL